MEFVNLYKFFPWTWLVHLSRALVIFNISHVVLKDKYNIFVTCLSIVFPAMIYSFCSLYIANEQNEILIMALYYVFIFILLVFITKGSVFAKLFTSVFCLIAYTTGTIVYRLFGNLYGAGITTVTEHEVTVVDLVFHSAFTYAFSFLFTAIIRFIKTKTNHSLIYHAKFALVFLLPVIHVFSIVQLSASFHILNEDFREMNSKAISSIFLLNVIFSLICMLIDFLIVFIVDYIEKTEENNILNERKIINNKLDYQQMLMFKKEKQEFRKIEHDYVNILTTAKGFIEIGKPEKALSILESTNNDLSGLVNFSICSNETINTIIYIKQQQAKKANIHLKTRISENYTIYVEDYDLCRLLSNIIDNALQAVHKTSGNKTVSISIDVDENKIVIKSENRFNDNTHSKAKKSVNHGNGVCIIKEIAEKYGGECVIWHFNGVWYTKISLENKKPLTAPTNFGLTAKI